MVANFLANLAVHHGVVERKTVSLKYQDQPYVERSIVKINLVPSWMNISDILS